MGEYKKAGRPSLKICGITSPEDLMVCKAAGVDYAGLNFVPTSPRFLQADVAEALTSIVNKQNASSFPCLVAVIADLAVSAIADLLSTHSSISVLQFHGSESVAYLQQLRQTLPRPVSFWKAVKIRERGDLDKSLTYHAAVDLLLFDGVAPGKGQSFDWSYLAGLSAQSGARPWGVAGGISLANVQALAPYGAHLIDVCSGAESALAKKDPAKIHALSKAIKDFPAHA